VGSRPPDAPRGREEASVSAGESMAELQQSDTDIGPILRWSLRQTEQPRPQEVMIESAAAKALWSQWHSLVLRVGVLFRQTEGKRGRPPVLQLIVPAVKRSEFISHCHRGMTGGHRAFRSTLDQEARRGFWIGWRRDVARFCRQCLSCNSYHRGRLPRAGHLQPMITVEMLQKRPQRRSETETLHNRSEIWW